MYLVTEHLDHGLGHVGRPHLHGAVAVPCQHDSVPGVLPQHPAGALADAVGSYHLARRSVLPTSINSSRFRDQGSGIRDLGIGACGAGDTRYWTREAWQTRVRGRRMEVDAQAS